MRSGYVMEIACSRLVVGELVMRGMEEVMMTRRMKWNEDGDDDDDDVDAGE